MEHIIQFARDDMAPATNQDNVAHFGKAQDSIGGLPNQGPGGRVQTEQLVHGVRDFGNSVFAHEPGKPTGQVMVFEDFFDEVLVENGPGRRCLWVTGLQQFSQMSTNAMPAGASLPRDRYRFPPNAIGVRVRDMGGVASRIQLAVYEAEASFHADGLR